MWTVAVALGFMHMLIGKEFVVTEIALVAAS